MLTLFICNVQNHWNFKWLKRRIHLPGWKQYTSNWHNWIKYVQAPLIEENDILNRQSSSELNSLKTFATSSCLDHQITSIKLLFILKRLIARNWHYTECDGLLNDTKKWKSALHVNDLCQLVQNILFCIPYYILTILILFQKIRSHCKCKFMCHSDNLDLIPTIKPKWLPLPAVT